MRRAAPTQRPPRVPGALVAACGVLLGLTSAAPARDHAEPPPDHEPRVWDAGQQLSPPARVELERRLATAESKSGVPIFLLVTDRVYGNSAAEVAATAFAAHGLGRQPARNAVLLAVALRSGEAAVETGKGNAGIVPEVDARRIAKQLGRQLTSQHPEAAIAQAITALAASAAATVARRTPLPRDPLAGLADDAPPPPAEDGAAPGGDDVVAPPSDGGRLQEALNQALVDAGGDGGLRAGAPTGVTPGSAPRSRLPIAIAIAVVVMVALALRRRKQLTSSRGPTDPDRRRRF